jgi:hypothetical protein
LILAFAGAPDRVVELHHIAAVPERDLIPVLDGVHHEHLVGLPEVAQALCAFGGFAGAVQRREQETDEDGDDADDD